MARSKGNPEIDRVFKLIKEHGVKIVDLKFTDMLGQWQHVSVTVGEFDPDRVGEAEEGRVRHPAELLDDCVVDLAPAVAVDVDPERTHAVEEAPAIDVEEVHSLAAFDDREGLLVPERVLGEGVPEGGAVAVAEFIA